MFVPSYGYSFVEIDLSGAEARVDRVLSGNFDLSIFDNPGIHRLTGSLVFDCRPDEIKKGSHQYHLAKTVRHAGERNMKHGRLSAGGQMALTREQVERFRELTGRRDVSEICDALLKVWDQRDAALAQVEQVNKNIRVIAGLANDKRKDNDALRAQLAEAQRVIENCCCAWPHLYSSYCERCKWLSQVNRSREASS